ncbi:MAG TPA: PDZ domain-containing protein [Candidatus Krumholzibacteriaceae bacterium]|nr:PDZ domain-containing protein [Candidatus Krumholzibacteriaceae bacterium]
MSFSKKILFSAAIFILIASLLPEHSESKEARLLRYPHIMGDKVVFVYAGDIWTVSAEGGRARRVTSFAEGLELFPKISPDGSTIAFSGEYAGTRQVYTIPYEGGVPERLTFYPDVGRMPPRGGYDYMILDWTKDGRILTRRNRTPFGKRVGKYYIIDPEKPGLQEALQIPEGGPATLSPDGKKIAYDIKSREFRTWKRYTAGRAQDVFIYDLEENETQKITEFTGTDNFPMWIGNSIYFISDRKKTLNLFKYDIASEEINQVTTYDKFDLLWPGRGRDRIIFEKGGYLFYYDTKLDKTEKIEITLGSDKPMVRPVYKNVKENIESFTISPSGARGAFGARGEIFTLPEKHGVTRNITRTEGVRERNVEWSPDGKYLLYLSEESGDYEIWIRPKDAEGSPRKLTEESDSWIIGPKWSPDSKKIVYTDKKNRLWVLDVESGKRKEADNCGYAGISNYSFSPDSRWLCYTKVSETFMSSIWVYSLSSKKAMKLTGDFSNDREPVFSLDGKYIYFISQRDFIYPDKKWEDRLYIGTLSEETPSPLAPLNDEEKIKKDDNDKEKEKEEIEIESIDADGFAGRVVALPLEHKHYSSLTAVKGGLVFIYTDETGAKELKKFDLKTRETKTVMEDVTTYEIAAEGEKFIYRAGKTFGIAKLAPGQDKNAGALDFKGMEMRIDPAVEWKQIYTDAWRIMRDWFYDPDMHKVDWKKMHDKYEVLLPHIAARVDLDYILGELIGELNAGHCYVHSGDMPVVDRVPVGLLGCEFKPDGDHYRIDRIYKGANWLESERSPLTEPGLNVKEGSYLIEIDGSEVTTAESPYKYLENKVGVQVKLKINNRPSAKGAREITVVPVASELKLLYRNWVAENRALADELSDGRIGYMHIPNTHYDGYKSFYRNFQPLMKKEALIIDERYNGGGHSPYNMVEIMKRKVYSYWARRNTSLYPLPFPVNEGPKAMLINGLSSSGGDAFPAYFREAGLGPLIGETTWGGLIGYGYSPHFVDGGSFAVPGFAFVNNKGEWDVEGVGLSPDEGFEVFDDPALIQAGREPMIERAVEYLLKKLEENPRREITKPEGPDRS